MHNCEQFAISNSLLALINIYIYKSDKCKLNISQLNAVLLGNFLLANTVLNMSCYTELSILS